MSFSNRTSCEWRKLVASYALDVLDHDEAESMAAHLTECRECQCEYDAVGSLKGAIAAWRNEALPPVTAVWDRLMSRIDQSARRWPAVAAADAPKSALFSTDREPQWSEVAPGITCKLLSTDPDRDRVTMLVRLAPGVSYPPHQHAGEEELYLMEGDLWIEERKLSAGDYYRAEPGTADNRVWSVTGCMCLLITSPSDQLR